MKKTLLAASLTLAMCNTAHADKLGMTSSNLNDDAATLGIEILERNTNIKLITDMDGKTVYTFADDKASGASVCYEVCADFWLPIEPPAGETVSAPFSIHTRKDGEQQLVYKNWPLYTFVHDVKPGDFNGYLFEGGGLGRWFIIREHAAELSGSLKMKTVKENLKYLVMFQKPLYVNPNIESCGGACANSWAPALVDAQSITAPFSLKEVPFEERKQLTYNGQPLFFFNFDLYSNITFGRNFNKEWDIVTIP